MPNYIKNRLTINADKSVIQEVTDMFGALHPTVQRTTYDGDLIYKNKDTNIYGYYNSTKNEFTFSQQVDKTVYDHIPDGYEPLYDDEWFQFPDFNKVISPPDDPAYRDEPSQQIAKSSPNWWYTWNCDNWGVKWNSTECESIDDNTFEWQTAWGNVINIIKKISSKFTDVEFEYMYADEDISSNCGSFIIKNGDIISENIPNNGSNEAYKLAFQLWKGYENDYELVDGEYRCKDDEE